MSQSERPTVTVLLNDRARAMVMSDEAAARLEEFAHVKWASGPAEDWDIGSLLDDASACITGWFTPQISQGVLDAHPDMKFVAHTAGTIRSLLPLDAVGPQVTVSHATVFFAPSVAEFTIMQMLSSLRHLPLLDAKLKGGDTWDNYTPGKHRAGLLGSRTVAVIGASRSGREVIRLCGAFGSEVLVVDPTASASEIKELGAEKTELDDALGRADIVTLHAPLLPETEELIGKRELSLIRDGAIFINSARGGLVNDDALYEAFASGRISGALDVFAEEPLPPNDRWTKLDNVIISPHRAGYTHEAHLRNGDAMVEEVRRWLNGEPLQHQIPTERVAITA